MHTATRLAAPVITRVRRVNRRARICGYGLYAPLNAAFLRSLGVDAVLGGEFEADLAAIAGEMTDAVSATRNDLAGPQDPPYVRQSMTGRPGPFGPGERPFGPGVHSIPRLQFLVPDRSGLPPLARYATLQLPDGTSKHVGSTEASRGCKHLCRHCPVVPVYQGQFRIVQPEVVLADIDALVAAGAGHITFGDPDFFNGPTHAMRLVEALHLAYPSVSYDVTIKIEHLLKHRGLLPRLAETGCAFVTSAVESLDDVVLGLLLKGHTRADFIEAVALCREAGLTLVPTFVAFHPWLTLQDYCGLLDAIAALDLVEHVAPIQLAIRLLIPDGSRILELEELRTCIGGFDAATLSYPWTHPDPRVDALQRDVAALVSSRVEADRRAVFRDIRSLAYERAGLPRASRLSVRGDAVPYINEPWYCCAEPNLDDMRLV
jgi:radical SAM superfamily enzyme YgiQ (UPF0313 family)